MKKQIRLATALLSFCTATLFSQVNVTGGPTATYSNVNAAFAAINAGIHTGAITIDITASTTEPSTPTPLLASGQSSANYTSIIIRPTVTATISGVMVTGRGVLEFDGADNVTIDGDIISGPVSRDLTISNDAAMTVAATAAVRFIGRTTGGLGATNNTVMNCIINGNTPGNDGYSGSTVTNSYGIYAGSNAVSLTSGGTGDNYDNLTFQNNEIKRAFYGLYVGGTATGIADNVLVNGNLMGSANAGENLSFKGILLNNTATSTITLNEVFNMKINTSNNNAGIEISGTSSSSVTVSRNKVYTIWSTSTGGYGAYGISLIGGNNHLIVNNLVYDILTTNYSATTTTWNAFGIRITSGTGIKIYYNSVNIYGNYTWTTTTAASAALLITSTAVTGLDIRNNIFANKMTSTATTKKFLAVWFPSSYNFLNATLNNNAYMVTNDADHFVGKIGTTTGVGEYSTLAAWQAISQVNNPSNDVNSIPFSNGNAPFMADNNLNIAANTITPIESGAVLIPSLGTNIDYNANVRPMSGINPNTNPDMGAYEFDGLAGVATDAGILAMPNPLTNGCYGSSENIVVTIKNFGTASISNIPVTVTVSGVASQTTNATYSGTLAPGASVNFTVGTLNMLTAGVYSFDAATSLAGDLNAPNDAMTTTTRTVIASVALPQTVSFTGFTGANLTTVFPNWYEAAGAAVPSGTTSNWLSQTGLNTTGNITARLNLFTTTRNEWIVGPKVKATPATQISFDAAVTDWNSITVADAMGSDDMVRVMVSTDCGVSFTPIFTINATYSLSTTLTNFNVALGSYAGQDIIVAFLATDGPVDDPEDYDFHLDNINLFNGVATDAGIQALTSPATGGCYGSAENMVVTIRNYGTNPISNIPVTVIVSGAATQTTNATYTGTIAPSTSVSFTVGTLNMLTAGVYSFNATSALAGDLNSANDAMTMVTRTVIAPVPLPQNVSFTGFTGANLTTVFPDWYEAAGVTVPTGTTSNWLSQTGLNGAGNITARINLYTTSRNEWIVGPKFTATVGTQLSFDAAVTDWNSITASDVMGSDDKVRVMVSTDCGLSYSPVFTISATNSLTTTFTNFNVSLNAYAGQDIIVAFLAQDGPVDDLEDYDFHLDNINLFNPASIDGGVSGLTAPTSTACYSANENVVVDIKNFGFNPISNVPVTVTIAGPTPQTLTATYTGTIAPSATASFTVGTANMSIGGVYSFTANTGLAGDPNAFNDAVTVTRTVSPIISITGNTSLCSGNSGTLTANGAAVSYTWNTSATTNSIVVTPSSTTIYTVIGTSASSCTTAMTVTVAVNNPTITGMGALYCGTSGTGTLTANAFSTVNWYSSPTSTVSLASGNTYVPPAAASTTTYYAEASNVSNDSLFTTLAAGNGFSGNMFDVVALNNIDINGVDMHFSSTGTATVEVWYRVGSFVGFETSNAGWIMAYTSTATALGTGSLTQIPGTFTVSIPAGQTYGFYVTALSSGPQVNYTNGTALGNIYVQNSDLQILQGKGGGYFSVTNSPRVFNGQLNYAKVGCTSPRIPVTLTVSPNPIVTASASSYTVCSGNSATLTANGATTYTWSTGATSSAIVITPSVNATYTVTGDNGGCSSSNTIAIMVGTSPTVTAVSNPSVLCAGSTATINAGGAISYTWSTGAMSTGILVTPSVTTTYTVYGEDPSGCIGFTTITQTVATCTGIDNSLAQNNGIFMYPNPAKESVTLYMSSVSNTMKLELYDALGKRVLRKDIEQAVTPVNIADLPDGIYIYRVTENSATIKQGKFVKE